MSGITNLKLFFSFFFLTSTYAFAQEDNPLPYVQKEAAYDIAPQFPGGPDSLQAYFATHIIYPEPEKSNGIEGYVMLKFEVTKKGKIINVSPVNGVPGGPNLVREAIRVVLSMPSWKSALKKGKPVPAEVNLNVPFYLNSNSK